MGQAYADQGGEAQKMKTAEAARGKWHGIMRKFGIDDSHLRNKHGPCPVCGGSDRFRFDDKDGSGSWYCNQCGSGSGFDLLKLFTGRDFKEIASEIDRIVGTVIVENRMPIKDPRPRLRRVAKELVPVVEGDEVDLYLNARGISYRDPAIKRHKRMTYYDDGKPIATYPAMVSLFVGPDGKPVTYHVVYLGEACKADVKSPKKILPPIDRMAGGAIRIGGEAESIGVCEGVETALRLVEFSGMPVWPCTSAKLLEAFQPPEAVKSITVYADNDSNYTGQRAAYILANRLALAGLNVFVAVPGVADADWLDVLNA